MKQIIKRNEPARLRDWRKKTTKFPDAHYDNHGFPVADVNAALVAEQGGLCAYTMIRITEATSHNEHLKPRSVSKNEDPPKYSETTDYQNLVACYPNTSTSDRKCPFGADARGNVWDPIMMITPLMGNCEVRFTFNAQGEIAHASDADEAAKWTIGTLRLNDGELQALRRQAVVSAGLNPAHSSALNARQARELAERICNRSAKGLFPPFCVAIRQVAIEYADKLEARKRKREFVRQSKVNKGKQK